MMPYCRAHVWLNTLENWIPGPQVIHLDIIEDRNSNEGQGVEQFQLTQYLRRPTTSIRLSQSLTETLISCRSVCNFCVRCNECYLDASRILVSRSQTTGSIHVNCTRIHSLDSLELSLILISMP